MTTQAKLKITITVPATIVAQFGNPTALRTWLQAHGIWPATVYDSRARIDPLSQGTVIELEVLLPAGDVPG